MPMKEIKSILKLYEKNREKEQKSALVQVVRVEDSSYRREGARMLIYESGIFVGGISGGCLEGDALQKSQIAIAKQFPTLVTYDTTNEDENNIGAGLGCNGIIDVLISPINEQNPFQITTLQKCISTRKPHTLVTLTNVNLGGNGLLSLGNIFYYDDETNLLENFPDGFPEIKAFLLDHIATLYKDCKSKTVQYEGKNQSVRAFIEIFPPPVHLAVFGDNYDVYSLIHLAKILDWKMSIVGNLHKMSKDALALVDELYSSAEKPEKNTRPLIDERTAILLMAHDYQTDYENLQYYWDSPAKYIGLLGPKKRFSKIVAELSHNKILLEKNQEKIFAPCGLEIGANFPEEIALSILAEILAVFSGQQGGMLKYKESPIHARI